jgi:hypothetical protein
MKPRVLLIAGAGLLVMQMAACDPITREIELAERRRQEQVRAEAIPPGLEPLYNKASSAPVLAPKPASERPPLADPEKLPFPWSDLPWPKAEALLAGDPVGLHFLALNRLAAESLIPLQTTADRLAGNLGAMLPLTHPQPPGVGLHRPLPPTEIIAKRFDQLFDASRGIPESRKAEQGFLLDEVMPGPDAPRAPLEVPRDLTAAREALATLDKRHKAGLIADAQRDAEAQAMQRLISAGGLPERLLPPPPPPPEPPPPVKKKTVKSGSTGGAKPAQRMPGGVHGGLQVIPSPPQVEAPRLTAGSSEPAGLHLLSMGTPVHAEKAFESLKKEFPELGPLGFTVSKADLGELGSTYRLIAGPTDSATAEKICAAIAAKGQLCKPTPFPK